jgi:peptide/nickel transport system ATP-binding protein
MVEKTMPESLFSVENLRIAYPQRSNEEFSYAVDNVSFSLQPGERMGLVGESGCGKSTLGRAVMRLLPGNSRVEGKINFQGKSVLDLTPSEMRKFRGEVAALVFQDPMTRLDPLMTIGNHCLETLKAHAPELSKKDARDKAIATLAKVNIPANRWNQYPHEFSGGMRQRVAIALALMLNPKLIIADEPTTSLDVTVSAQILQELTRLCSEENMALLLISHDLAMVAEYCDRIGVMYFGKMVETGSTDAVFRHPQHEYTQSLLKAALHIQSIDEVGANGYLSSEEVEGKQPTGNAILRVKELQQHYAIEPNLIERWFNGEGQTIKAVDGINLELYQGEILGLVGESGCGKSTLSRTILQLIRPTGGKVAMSVGQNIGDPLLIHGIATPGEAKQQVLAMLERVGLVPAETYYQRYASELSGGQQQRVAIARALITRPKLLICDEPVSMLDASVQSQVLDLMLELKDEFELTYLFITHDLWLARFLCDRIAVMNGGKIVELGNTKEIFKNPQHEYTKKLLGAAPLLARA